MNHVSVVLVGAQNAGNVGAIARVMANFSCSSLVLIDPKCDHLSQVALRRAKHGKDILRKAKVRSWAGVARMHTLVATSAMLGSDYNVSRSPISPKDLAQVLPSKGKVGLVFGREDHGLSNEEVERCDFIVSIPSSKKYPVLNLSQAVGVVLYELFQGKAKTSSVSHIALASAVEKRQLSMMVGQLLDSVRFQTPSKKRTQELVWKKLIGKSFLTKREAFALMGFFRKLLR